MGLDGSAGRLASVGGQGGPRIGRYVVHVANFEAVALPQLEVRPGLELDPRAPRGVKEYRRRTYLNERWKLYAEQHQDAEPYPDRRRRRQA